MPSHQREIKIVYTQDVPVLSLPTNSEGKVVVLVTKSEAQLGTRAGETVSLSPEEAADRINRGVARLP